MLFLAWEIARAVQSGSSSMLAPAARFLKKAGQKLLFNESLTILSYDLK